MYYINLAKKPEIYTYPQIVIDRDLKFYGVKNVFDLDDHDFRIFKTPKEATTFLNKYLKVLNSLDNKKICNSRELPAMLYKRRYIVLTLMGKKTATYRKYKKDWKKGQRFNLHDQTYFLTVELTSLVKDRVTGLYKYSFKLVK